MTTTNTKLDPRVGRELARLILDRDIAKICVDLAGNAPPDTFSMERYERHRNHHIELTHLLNATLGVDLLVTFRPRESAEITPNIVAIEVAEEARMGRTLSSFMRFVAGIK